MFACLFNFNFHSLIPEKLLSAFSKKVQDCRHCAILYMLIKSEKIFFYLTIELLYFSNHMTFILMGFPCFSKTFLNARHFMNLWFKLFFSINDKKKLIRIVYFWKICALIFFCSPSQNAKLLCFLNYFERIGNHPSSNKGNIRFYRQVCWYLH